MGRLLFVCHDAGGTVPPVLATASALRDLGHEVTILSQPSVADRATALGCDFVAFSETPDYRRDTALEDQLDRTLPPLIEPGVGDDLLAVAHTAAPDALIVDPNLSGALAAAETMALPSVVLLHSVFKTFVDVWFGELWPLLAEPINATRARFGASAASSWADTLRHHELILAPVPQAFDAPVDDVPAHLRHVGFLVPSAPREPIELPPGKDPLVAVSFSTTHQHQDELIAESLAALADEAVRVVATTSGYGPMVDAPANAVVADFVPHAALFDKAEIVITHGGLGTIAAALQAGVPLVCIPLGRDQPLNASRVAALGAGRTHHPGSGPPALRHAVRDLLSNTSYRAAAGRLAALSRAAGQAQRAAAEIDRLLPEARR